MLEAGDAVAITHDQVLDITNVPGAGGRHQAEWLVSDPALISAFVPPAPGSPLIDGTLGR
jgi:hypothetical protein